MTIIKTPGHAERILEKMFELVNQNQELQNELKKEQSWQDRWSILEKFILENLGKVRINSLQYSGLWLRERFFLEMQNKTRLDYGFCPYFISAYHKLTESILTDRKNLNLWHKCTYKLKESPIETICSGTDRDVCVLLNPPKKITSSSH